MPKYMDTAAQANSIAHEIISRVPAEEAPIMAELLARLVNLGVRISPRGVHHTIRLNAVKAAMKGLPVRVSMQERTDERTKRTYNALITEPINPRPEVHATATVEGASGEDE